MKYSRLKDPANTVYPQEGEANAKDANLCREEAGGEVNYHCSEPVPVFAQNLVQSTKFAKKMASVNSVCSKLASVNSICKNGFSQHYLPKIGQYKDKVESPFLQETEPTASGANPCSEELREKVNVFVF